MSADLQALIADLSAPSAWEGGAVEVRQTHASVVFLVGDRAWKLKKPVSLGFLDFSTAELRRRCCEAEVRVNRRLAPRVYLGVREVVRRDGAYRVGGPGEVVDHVVEMLRLPDDATLEARLARDEVDSRLVVGVAERIARFHGDAEGGPEISAWGRFDVVAANARDNFAQSRGQAGPIVHPRVHARLEALTEAALAEHRERIEARARRGVPRDTHGDLRLEHVYAFPDRAAPDDLVVLDAIEFNDAFRFADPVADLAFLAMDLGFRGRDDLAEALCAAWLRASGDEDGRPLFPLYRSYRAAVRGKVAGMKGLEPEVSVAERARAVDESRARWLFALGELERPGLRPALVGVGGLPGTGKSTLSRALTAAGFEVIRSDVVRKELAGLRPQDRAGSAIDTGLYTPAHTARTYAECLRRAEIVVRGGGRALVDASFRDEGYRRALLATARANGVPAALLLCEASPSAVRARLARREGDASDADWAVYQHAAAAWRPPSGEVARITAAVHTDASREHALATALEALRQRRLAEGDPRAERAAYRL